MANLDWPRGEAGRRTTVQIYADDLEWLRARQREVSFQRGETIPMFDVIRELIKAVRTEGEGA